MSRRHLLATLPWLAWATVLAPRVRTWLWRGFADPLEED